MPPRHTDEYIKCHVLNRHKLQIRVSRVWQAQARSNKVILNHILTNRLQNKLGTGKKSHFWYHYLFYTNFSPSKIYKILVFWQNNVKINLTNNMTINSSNYYHHRPRFPYKNGFCLHLVAVFISKVLRHFKGKTTPIKRGLNYFAFYRHFWRNKKPCVEKSFFQSPVSVVIESWFF